jgi:hypothetical protein
MTDDFEDWLEDHNWHCKDCGVHTGIIGEYYMVTKDIWSEHGCEGMLCISCLEGRMSRRLSSRDFTNFPINTGVGIHRSKTLTDRLFS